MKIDGKKIKLEKEKKWEQDVKVKQDIYKLSKLGQALVKQGKKGKAEEILSSVLKELQKIKNLEKLSEKGVEEQVKVELCDWKTLRERVTDQGYGRDFILSEFFSKKEEVGEREKMRTAEVKFILNCIKKARPYMEYRLKPPKKRNGELVIVSFARGVRLGINWIITGAKNRPEKNLAFKDRLYLELLAVAGSQGYAGSKLKEWYESCKKGYHDKRTGIEKLRGE